MATKNPKRPRREKPRADRREMMDRVKQFIGLASASDGPTRKELAEMFGITERAVANFIDFVRHDVGVTVVTQRRASDGKRAYAVQATDFLRQELSVSEAIASVMLTEAILGTPLAPDDKSAADGAHRLRQGLGESVRAKLDRLKGRFAVRLLRATKAPRPGTFGTVLDGILENRVLAVDYESPYAPRRAGSGGVPGAAIGGGADGGGPLGKARKIETVQIEPYGVFFARRSWYVLARKRSVQGMRLYKLARFKRVELTSATFELPRGWTVEGYMANDWETMHADGPPVRVVVDLDARVAGNLVETQWHPSQQVTLRPDGSARFTVRVSGIEEIFWWVLGHGRHARVIEPPELKARIAAEARAMAALLEGDR